MKHYQQLIKLTFAFLLGFSIAMPSMAKDDDTYDQDSILKDATPLALGCVTVMESLRLKWGAARKCIGPARQ